MNAVQLSLTRPLACEHNLNKQPQSSTVTSLCMDTPCDDILDVRTTQLGTNHCSQNAVIPLRKDNSM